MYHKKQEVGFTLGGMEDTLARGAYQIFLYALLYIGIAALGAFVGYIASFLYHGGEEPPEELEEAEDTSRDESYKSPR